ncbi:cupin domain-containing protein [Nocardioides sp. SR21]|uniref:cupin domain-containing protein n=1 Tax=Nocardioides sp. SR21 TaxID=2919501 RepID=UPI001FA9A1CD|nr:cupin domain-containing protein [Nocardioides sp. SR21]
MGLELPRPLRVLTPADLTTADPTSGMQRRLAFELPLLWSGQVETAPGLTSGWHHHDRNESSLYVVRGVLRLEFEGHEGYLDAVAGDYVHVPSYTVHRESNPGREPSLAVIARVGGGVPTVNVDEPPPPHGP